MNTFLLVSNLLLWAALLVLAFMFFLLSKLVADFINRFQSPPRQQAQTVNVLLGQQAPLFRETDQHGSMIKLADYAGRNVLLLFSSESCGVCRETIPRLPALRLKHPGLEILVLSSSPDFMGTYTELEDISVLRSQETFTNYLIEEVPTMILMNEQGRIIRIEVLRSSQELANHLEGLMRAS